MNTQVVVVPKHGLLLSNFVGTRSTSLQLAVLALKNVPMGPTVAHRANPLNECRFRLEEVKRVVTITGNRHFEVRLQVLIITKPGGGCKTSK